MPVWLEIAIALGSPILTVIGTAFVFGSRFATLRSQTNANAAAIDRLLEDKVSVEQGKGLQAQIKRLEEADAGCKSEIAAVRNELHDRVERHSNKISAVEQTVAAAVGEIKATMSGMKEAMDRWEARAVATPLPTAPEAGLITQLNAFAGIMRAFKEMKELAH